jgi:glycosyltransferase involved in cell wall biosynthesis
VDKLAFQAAFFSPAWVRAIREVITEYRPHVLHVHDIWLGRSALRARTDQKITFDLHENMPAAVVEYLKGYRGAMKWFSATFKNRPRVMLFERSLLEASDLVLVVVEEARERVLREHPRLDPANVVNIENLESKTFAARGSASERVISNDHFSILYIGGFGPHRGIDTLIEAMKHLKAWGVNARLHLVGAREGAEYLRMLRQLIARLDVESHVTITGWVPAASVPGYISEASVGAVPHHANAHTDNTIPHKLYQYMISSTAVLVSTSRPLARTVRAAGAGAIFEAGNALDCAHKIRELASHPERLREFGRSGYRYVVEQGHNWEDGSAPALVAAYDGLLDCHPRPVVAASSRDGAPATCA